MNRIRIGAVSYLNTKPLLYGVYKSPGLLKQIELIEDYPARVAEMLKNDQVDIGLVPVAVIPELPFSSVVSDYCIAATGPVASVCIFSEVPIEQVSTVLLDYQSKTSVNLAKILLKEYWRKPVEYRKADKDFCKNIQGTTAAVVIGDRALEQLQKSRYVYDLAEAWIDYTGLPFVFAAWVANKPIPQQFIADFNKANSVGFSHLDEIVKEQDYPHYDLHKYYEANLSYILDDKKKAGMDKFLEYLRFNAL